MQSHKHAHFDQGFKSSEMLEKKNFEIVGTHKCGSMDWNKLTYHCKLMSNNGHRHRQNVLILCFSVYGLVFKTNFCEFQTVHTCQLWNLRNRDKWVKIAPFPYFFLGQNRDSAIKAKV